jgi:hypothetical protein
MLFTVDTVQEEVLQDCTGAHAAMRSAVAQARILAEYLNVVEAEEVDLRFVDNHIRSLYQFASTARNQALPPGEQARRTATDA